MIDQYSVNRKSFHISKLSLCLIVQASNLKQKRQLTYLVGSGPPKLYTFNAPGPPQYSVLLPLQSMLHLLAGAGCAPLEIFLPQSV